MSTESESEINRLERDNAELRACLQSLIMQLLTVSEDGYDPFAIDPHIERAQTLLSIEG